MVAGFKGGSPDVEASASRVDKFTETLTSQFGLKTYETIDELVETHAVNWRVSRMAAVDRNILRLAIYELLYTETPVSVVLDEAIAGRLGRAKHARAHPSKKYPV